MAIFLIAVGLYWRSLFGRPIWDDHVLIDQSQIGGHTVWQVLTGHVLLLYYRPLTGLSYFVDGTLFGRDPVGFHATSILIHALASMAVAWAAYRILSCRAAGFFAGLVFAAQPAQVAATAWIGGRTDDLSCLFVAAFTACLFEFLIGKRSMFLAVSAVFFFCAIGAKEQNLALVPLAPIAAHAAGVKKLKDSLKITAPFLAAACLFLAPFFLYKSNVMRSGALPIAHELQRIGDSSLHYSKLLFLPDSNAIEAFSLKAYGTVSTTSLGLILLTGYVAAASFTIRSNPRIGFVLWAALLAYFPASNVVPAPSLIVAPYRVAVAGVFVAILISYGLVVGYRTKQHVLSLVAAACIVLGVYWTIAGIGLWLDEADFFKISATGERTGTPAMGKISNLGGDQEIG